MMIISALEKQRQENYKFEASKGYIPTEMLPDNEIEDPGAISLKQE